jgi:hypothetical protein
MKESYELIKSHRQASKTAYAILQKCHVQLLAEPNELEFEFTSQELDTSIKGEVSVANMENLASELLGLQLSVFKKTQNRTETRCWPLFKKVVLEEEHSESKLCISFNAEVLEAFQRTGSKKLYLAE